MDTQKAHFSIRVFKSSVLNLWATTLFELRDLFPEVTYQIAPKSDIYITGHNSSKIAVMKWQQR